MWGIVPSMTIDCLSDLARQCLGHRSLEKLCFLVPSLSSLNASCQLGKHDRHSCSPGVRIILCFSSV